MRRALGAAVVLLALLAVAGCGATARTPTAAPREVGADCGAGPLPAEATGAAAEAARKRVEAFIADYHSAWERAGQPGGSFEAWDAERAVLARTHLVDEDAFALDEGGLSSPAHHDPATERIDRVSVDDGGATVSTEVGGTSPGFSTYRVVRTGAEWRIARTTLTLEPPTAPLLGRAAHAALMAQVAPGTRLHGSPRSARTDVDALFAPPYDVAELTPITTSGVMAVQDPGWLAFDVVPLAQRVPAGTYPVEVAHRRDGLNAALRVRFADERAARWVVAARVGGGHDIPVDTGTVGIVDFTTAPTCRNEWLERLYADHVGVTDGTCSASPAARTTPWSCRRGTATAATRRTGVSPPTARSPRSWSTSCSTAPSRPRVPGRGVGA